MKIDYSTFKRGMNYHGKVTVTEDGVPKTITAQLQPDDEGEIHDSQKETLEMFLDNYPEYKQILLKSIFEYYQSCRDEWGDVEPDDELFPEVKDMDKISEMISFRGLIVLDEAYSGKRAISLFYNCTWDEEEGMGIRIALGDSVSEFRVTEIGIIGAVY